MVEKKYNKDKIDDLAKEKLNLLELVTIFTFLERCQKHVGDGDEWYDKISGFLAIG